jgi:hypothetical protein
MLAGGEGARHHPAATTREGKPIVVNHRTSAFVETDLATLLRANRLVPHAAAQSRLCGGPASQRPPSGAGRNASTTRRTGATAQAARGDRNWIVGPSSGRSAKLVARSPAPTHARAPVPGFTRSAEKRNRPISHAVLFLAFPLSRSPGTRAAAGRPADPGRRSQAASWPRWKVPGRRRSTRIGHPFHC